LISDASENVGLGHDFLRSIERARALAYVVDLNSERPWDELEVLRNELEAYKAGLSSKCRMVIANKADLLVHHTSEISDVNGGPQEAGLEEQIKAAKEKLASLEYLVQERLGPLDIVAVSAKYNQNLRRVVRLLSSYVQASRTQHGHLDGLGMYGP
jgi:GTPase